MITTCRRLYLSLTPLPFPLLSSILSLIQTGGVGIGRGTFSFAYMMQKYPGAPFDKKH